MAKEYDEYRPVLETLFSHFGKTWLTAKEVAEYDGIDPRSASKWFGIPREGIDITVLAYRRCQLAHKKAPRHPGGCEKEIKNDFRP